MMGLVMVAAPMLGGCVAAAKEAYYTTVGAEGKLFEVENVGSLADYDSFAIEPFSSDVGSFLSPKLAAAVRPKIAEQLLKQTVLNTTGRKTLTIRGKVVYVDMQGLGSGAISPLEQLACHVQLVDPSGTVLGWAVVAGVNKSRVRGATGGEDELATGLGKGIVDWLNKHGVPKRQQQ